jgi:hypothetical protein
MALTLEEQHLCRHAAVDQHARGDGWGSPTLGLCPIGAVVTHRGGQLYLWPAGTYSQLPPPNQGPSCVNLNLLTPDERRAYDALTRLVAEVQAEVLAWSGHQHWRTFTDALRAHGTAALPEA